jgi:hypothetical protein
MSEIPTDLYFRSWQVLSSLTFFTIFLSPQRRAWVSIGSLTIKSTKW